MSNIDQSMTRSQLSRILLIGDFLESGKCEQSNWISNFKHEYYIKGINIQ